ncbi:MAG: type II toxin-antitoxin system PemK/MazF family toxin [Candidatus Eisenbacteria bacterium]|nr:type II toxin-antitoxin system PemK/MazF family toxin [Candidatus Eisenbacteria bacterium]
MALHPGDIYLSSAYGKPRPIVIVSREDLNRGRYVVAVPLTSRRLTDRWGAGNCVALQRGEAGLAQNCVAQCEAVSMVRVDELDLERGYVGALGEATLDEVVRAIGYVISAECKRR